MVDLETAYRRDGFVITESALSVEELAALRRWIDAAGPDEEPNPLTLDSMTFASNLFRRSTPLAEFLASETVVSMATALRGPDLWVRWDQAVWKGPGAPVFPWHQDNGYTGLGEEHLQMWVALSDMTEHNGGLVVSPGGHRRLLTHEWTGGHVHTIAPTERLAIHARAGDVVWFSSLLPHMTGLNTTASTRLAYVAEFYPISAPDLDVASPHLVVSRSGRPSLEWLDLRSQWPRR